jgi:hypothetical protein
MDWVTLTEQRLLPPLHTLAEQLANEFPAVRVQVYSIGFGGCTPHPGHAIGLNCFFRGRDDYPDEVTLEIVLGPVNREPTIEADVEWGYPGHTEADLLPGAQPLTEPVLTTVAEGLPVLFDALRSAVRRGFPPSRS